MRRQCWRTAGPRFGLVCNLAVVPVVPHLSLWCHSGTLVWGDLRSRALRQSRVDLAFWSLLSSTIVSCERFWVTLLSAKRRRRNQRSSARVVQQRRDVPPSVPPPQGRQLPRPLLPFGVGPTTATSLRYTCRRSPLAYAMTWGVHDGRARETHRNAVWSFVART